MKEKKIGLKTINVETLKVKIIGTSPYLAEPMDMEVLERYDSKKAKKNYSKDDVSEEEKVKNKYYYTTDGEIGIPARAFFNAMIRASSYIFEKSAGGMRNVKEGLIVKGDILPLNFTREEVLTHWGRTSGQSKAPRKIMRNAFYDWSVELNIHYNGSQLSPEQVINILNWAGFHIGVGGFRKEKTGNFGMFKVKL